MIGLRILERQRQVAERHIQAFADIREKVELDRRTLANILAGTHDTSWVDARLRAIGCDPIPR